MNYENLWEKAMEYARNDPEYLWYQNQVQSAEKVYLEVCESLSPEQKMAVEDYIAACEHLGDYLLSYAYDLGKHGK